MKRNIMLATIATVAVAVTAPAPAKPGGGGGQARGVGNVTVQGTAKGDLRGADADARTDANVDAATGSRMKGDTFTGSRIPRGDRSEGSGASVRSSSSLTADIDGLAVVDSEGTSVGTVTGVTTKGNGSVRTVQVTLSDGQIITLAPNSLTLNGDVLTTTSVESNVNSQGAAHANINGLIHASPNSALASAGVTSLTGLATDLTVNNSVGDPLGTVDQIIMNRSGAVVGINVELTGGGTIFVPATTLSMDGTTVVTSSTQF